MYQGILKRIDTLSPILFSTLSNSTSHFLKLLSDKENYLPHLKYCIHSEHQGTLGNTTP